MDEVSFDVPDYYKPEFKGRPKKYCPECGKKLEYDGWSIDAKTQKISEWWFCKRCDEMFENPK